MEKILCLRDSVVGGRDERGRGHYKPDSDWDVKFLSGIEYDIVFDGTHYLYGQEYRVKDKNGEWQKTGVFDKTFDWESFQKNQTTKGA